jgi:hypothetical protein
VDGILLDVEVEAQSSPRHPVRLVSGVQGREPLWCAGSDHGRSVRRPPDLGIDQPVDLTNEVLVCLLRLLPSPTCCKEREKLSESNYRTHNVKNHVKGGHYLPETPQRTHGGEVRWVGAVGRRCDNPTRDNSVLSPKPLHLVME